jgi:hypothetical protein
LWRLEKERKSLKQENHKDRIGQKTIGKRMGKFTTLLTLSTQAAAAASI